MIKGSKLLVVHSNHAPESQLFDWNLDGNFQTYVCCEIKV